MAASRKNSTTSNRGLGSLRMIFHIMMLIDPILRAGESANESVGKVPGRRGGQWGLAHQEFSV